MRGPALQPRPRPIPRPSCPRPAPSADRLRGAAQPAPPPPSAQVGGVADEGRDVLVGGGPGDGIRARRAGAQNLTVSRRGTILTPKQVGVGRGGVAVEDRGGREEARVCPLPEQAWTGWHGVGTPGEP